MGPPGGREIIELRHFLVSARPRRNVVAALSGGVPWRGHRAAATSTRWSSRPRLHSFVASIWKDAVAHCHWPGTIPTAWTRSRNRSDDRTRRLSSSTASTANANLPFAGTAPTMPLSTNTRFVPVETPWYEPCRVAAKRPAKPRPSKTEESPSAPASQELEGTSVIMEDILWHLDSPIRRMRVQAIRRIAAVVPSVDEALVDWALTAPGDWQVRNSEDNERLEFLGDAVLEVVVTETVHRAFPRKKTGSLQRVVGHVVSNRSLKVISRALELHGGLISGKKRAGDAVEALVAAAYAGGGFPAAREVVARLFDPLIVEGAEMKLVGLDWNGMLFRIARELGVGGISIAVHDGAGSKVQCTITAANESLPLGEAMAKTRWTAERQASALAYLALSRRKPWWPWEAARGGSLADPPTQPAPKPWRNGNSAFSIISLLQRLRTALAPINRQRPPPFHRRDGSRWPQARGLDFGSIMGGSVMRFVVADTLFRAFPTKGPGFMTDVRHDALSDSSIERAVPHFARLKSRGLEVLNHRGLKVAVAQTYVSEGIEKAAVLVGQAFDPMVAEGVETRLVVDWKERLSKLEARDGVLDLAITNEVCSVFGETSFLCRVTVPSRNVSVEAVQATLADAERRAAALAYLALARTANWKSVSMIADRVANIR